jgi:hypothetical protein
VRTRRAADLLATLGFGCLGSLTAAWCAQRAIVQNPQSAAHF